MRKHVMKTCLVVMLLMVFGCMTVFANTTVMSSSANKWDVEEYTITLTDQNVVRMTALCEKISVPRCYTVARNISNSTTYYMQSSVMQLQYPSGSVDYKMTVSGYLTPGSEQKTSTLTRHIDATTLYYQHKTTVKGTDDYIYNIYQFRH